MHHIGSDKQRYAMRAILYRTSLKFHNVFKPFHVEESTYLSIVDEILHLHMLNFAGHNVSAGRQIQLSDFFIKGHYGHQAVNDSGRHGQDRWQRQQ